MGYFTVEVKPLMPASTQHAAAFTAGDLLFDWFGFEIPRGGAKLVGVTALVRPKGDAGPTPNNFGFDLIFGKVGTSLGTGNAVGFLVTPQEDILGSVNIATSNFTGPDSAVSTSCTSVASVSGVDMVISPDVTALNTGANVGYDKFYVAGIANGAIDLTSAINIIAADTAVDPTITVDGTGANLVEQFRVGDVIQLGNAVSGAAADVVMGTVASITGATELELTANSANVSKDGSIIYNQNPIKLLLHFEK